MKYTNNIMNIIVDYQNIIDIKQISILNMTCKKIVWYTILKSLNVLKLTELYS